MRRARFAAVMFALLAYGPLAAQSPCPSADVKDVAQDPVVQDALNDAWRDSHEGFDDEHEEGGWIYQCQTPGGGYETRVVRWPSGTGAESSPTPPPMDPGCRLVASFHTHPGGMRGDNNGDTYSNNKPSVADYEFARANGIPGILVWGTGTNSHVRTYGEKETTEPSSPAWTCPGAASSQASGWGEPHLRTFDGYTYDFQAIGDFTLAQSTDGDLDIQSRHQPWHDSKSVAATTGLVVRDGDDRVEWTGGVFDPIINGRLRPMNATETVNLLSWAQLRRTDDGFVLTTGHGDRLTVNVGNEYLDYFIRLAPHRKGKMRGLLGGFDGDPDNDLQTAAGRPFASPPDAPLDTTHPLYAVFAASWRVPADHSLFANSFTSSMSPATFPQQVPPIDDATSAAAAQKCDALNIKNDDVRRACAFDMAVTRDDAFLKSAARASVAADVSPTPEGLVRVDREITGSIQRADQHASFDVDLNRGAYVIDARGSRDTAWTMTSADGSQLFDANQSIYMGQYPVRVMITNAGRYRVSVGARPQTTRGQFRFRVRTVPAPLSKTIQVGATVSGRIGSIGEEHEYAITLTAGQYDLRSMTAEDTAWSLIGPAGQPVFDANQQEFMESVSGLTIKTPGRYTLVIRGRGMIGIGNYAFSVVAR